MMVRDPRLRLFSAYHNNMHAYGLMVPHETLEHRVSSLADFIAFPGIRDCQVKMLNGLYCAQSATVTTEMVDRAIRMLEKAAFVGITDEWNDAMCLFDSIYDQSVPGVAFRNVRDTETRAESGYDRAQALQQIRPEDDPHDWRLFEAARIIFRKNQHRYGAPYYSPP